MINFLSDDWGYIKDRLTKRLEAVRGALEIPDKTNDERLVLIGQIKAIKETLNMPQDVHNVTAANKGKQIS